jgi:hypothetical protein
MLWPMEPTVAASDFDPFTKAVAMPVTVQSASTRPLPSAKGGATTRPMRRNLLEMGLACGDGAAELEAALQQADAAERQADKAAGVDGSIRAEDAGEADGAAAGAADPAALEALATEIQAIARKRDRLAEELADLERERAELQAQLMALLGKAGLRSPRPTAPAPPAPPPGTGLPTAAWR